MTSTARTIDARAYREARAEGLSPALAAVAGRPAVLALDWLDHYQADEEWATFTLHGRTFRAEAIDPRAVEGTCTSCAELVDAYRRQDDGMAWLTPEEYDTMTHAALTVYPTDENGSPTGPGASLWGVCSLDRTPTERRMAERYTAETVAELAAEALTAEEDRPRYIGSLTEVHGEVVDVRPCVLPCCIDLPEWEHPHASLTVYPDAGGPAVRLDRARFESFTGRP